MNSARSPLVRTRSTRCCAGSRPTATWGSAAGNPRPARPRRYYRLTADGRRRLGAIEREWVEMVNAVDTAVVKAEVA